MGSEMCIRDRDNRKWRLDYPWRSPPCTNHWTDLRRPLIAPFRRLACCSFFLPLDAGSRNWPHRTISTSSVTQQGAEVLYNCQIRLMGRLSTAPEGPTLLARGGSPETIAHTRTVRPGGADVGPTTTPPGRVQLRERLSRGFRHRANKVGV